MRQVHWSGPPAGRDDARRRSRQQAGDDRQRQRDQDSPADIFEPEERQLPDQRAIIAEQIPGGDEGDRRADIGAEQEKRAGDRIDRERPARQHRAHHHGDEQAQKARFAADHARHHFARQQPGDESGDQAAGRHFRQHADEKLEILGQDGDELVGSIAHIDDGAGRGREVKMTAVDHSNDLSRRRSGMKSGALSRGLTALHPEPEAAGRSSGNYRMCAMRARR